VERVSRDLQTWYGKSRKALEEPQEDCSRDGAELRGCGCRPDVPIINLLVILNPTQASYVSRISMFPNLQVLHRHREVINGTSRWVSPRLCN